MAGAAKGLSPWLTMIWFKGRLKRAIQENNRLASNRRTVSYDHHLQSDFTEPCRRSISWGKIAMASDWYQLRHSTVAAQVSFLEAEVGTGLTLARIALQSADAERRSRNAQRARKAYDTLSYITGLPPQTPGLEAISEKMKNLQHMLALLEGRS